MSNISKNFARLVAVIFLIPGLLSLILSLSVVLEENLVLVAASGEGSSQEGEPSWTYSMGNTVKSVDVSSDGELIAASSDDDKIYLFDKDSSTPVWTYTAGSDVHRVAISADGNYVAAASEDKKLYLFRSNSSTPVWTYTASDRMFAVDLSADGEYIVAGGYNYNVYLFHKNSSTPEWSYSTGYFIDAVAISANGEYLCAGSEDDNFYMFDKDSNSPEISYDTGGNVLSVAISDDGSYMAAGSESDNVYLFKNGETSPEWSYTTGGDAQTVSISGDGKHIVAGSHDNKVYLFDKDSSTPAWSYSTGGTVYWVDVSSDGERIVAGSSDSDIYHFNGASSTPLWSYSTGGALYSTAISDGESYTLAGGGAENKLYFFTKPLPDLAFDSNGISLSEDSPTVGTSIEISVKIVNLAYHEEINGWREIDTSTNPSERTNFAYCFDKNRNSMILFGGYKAGGSSRKDDTWIYDLDDRTWEQQSPSSKPGARAQMPMACDQKNDKTILFGGWNGGAKEGDTWAYDPTTDNWANRNPNTKPNARDSHAMVFDSINNVTLLFGGGTNSGPTYNDTWKYDYDDNNWTNLNPPVAPSVRSYPAFLYDNENERAVLYGGTDGDKQLNDMWYYYSGNNTWVNVTKKDNPTARPGPVFKFDPNSDSYLLSLGHHPDLGATNETWRFDISEETWTLLELENAPPPRHTLGSVFSPQDNRLMMFGGSINSTNFDDTWELNGSITAMVNFYEGDPEEGGSLIESKKVSVWGNGLTEVKTQWTPNITGYQELWVKIVNVVPDDSNWSNNQANLEVQIKRDYSKSVVTSDWWNKDWDRRKLITIDNTANNESLQDYQVRLNISYNPNMNKNFSDLRFIDQYGDEASFWLQEKSEMSYAVVWVKIPYIKNNTEVTIYMYYSSSINISLSNGSKTFIFFDDFTDGKFDGWTPSAFGRGEMPTFVNDTVKMRVYIPGGEQDDNGNSYSRIETDTSASNKITIDVKYRVVDKYEDDDYLKPRLYNNSWNELYVKDGEDGDDWYYYSGHNLSLDELGFDVYNIFGSGAWGTRITELYVDYVFLHAFLEKEPNVSIGMEESLFSVAVPYTQYFPFEVVEIQSSLHQLESTNLTFNIIDPEGIAIDISATNLSTNLHQKPLGADEQIIGHWHFDEGWGPTAEDSSNNGNDGELKNGLEWVDAKISKGLLFDGDDDLSFDDVNLNDHDNGTLSFWFKRTATLPVNDVEALMSYGNFDINWDTRVADASEYLRFQIYDGTWYKLYGGDQDWDSGVWFHIAVSWGKEGMKLFINGTLVDSNSYYGNGESGDKDLHFGNQYGSQSYFNGLVDELEVFEAYRQASDFGLHQEATYNLQLGPRALPGTYTVYANISDGRSSMTTFTVGALQAKTDRDWYYPGETIEVGAEYYELTPTNITLELLNPEGEIADTINDIDTSICGWEHIADDNTVGLLHFNEGYGSSTADASGNNNNGSFKDQPSWVDGKIGLALGLDGSDDGIIIPDSSELHLSTFTLEAFIKPDSLSYTKIIEKGIGSATQYSLITYGNGSLSLAFHDDSGSPYHVISESNTIVIGKWHHILGSYDGSKMAIYVNGTLVGEKSVTVTPVDSNKDIYIGSSEDNNDYFDGIIDELHISKNARDTKEFHLFQSAKTEWTLPQLEKPGIWTLRAKQGAVGVTGTTTFEVKNLVELEINKEIYQGGDGVEITASLHRWNNETLGLRMIDPMSREAENLTVKGRLESSKLVSDEKTVGLYFFDHGQGDKAYDASGWANDGSLENDPYWISGMLNSGIGFDGSNDYIEIDDVRTIADNSSDSWTIELWFKANRTNGNDNLVTFAKKSGSHEEVINLRIESNKLYATIRPEGEGANAVVSTTPFSDTVNWHHVAFVFDNFEDEGRLYFDGDLKITLEVESQYPAHYATLGAWRTDSWPSGTNFFEGILDEVRISNYVREPWEFQLKRQYTKTLTLSGDAPAGTWTLVANTSEGVSESLEFEVEANRFIIVDPNGNGDHTTIQNAVNAAVNDTIIYVWEGSYNEAVIVDKKVSIIGNGTGSTEVNGGSGDGFQVKIDGVTIRNLTVRNKDGDGIDLRSDHNILRNLNLSSNSGEGVMFTSSSGNLLENLYIYDNQRALYVYNRADDNTIREVTAHGSSNDNIAFDNTQGNLLENVTCINPGGFDLFMSQSYVTVLNSDIDWSDMNINGELTVQNYLEVEVVNGTDSPLRGVDIQIKDEDQTIYATDHYGGSDAQTDGAGLISWIVVTDRIYKSSTTATENKTEVDVHYDEATGNREVDMSTSHTEKFELQAVKPDLSVESDDISFDPSEPRHNDTINLTVTIHNLAERDATATIAFYLGDPDGSGSKVDEVRLSVEGEDSNSTRVSWKAQEGTHDIYVRIEGVSPEDGNNSNHKAFKELEVLPERKPDLSLLVNEFSMTPSDPAHNDTVNLTIPVHNIGEAPGKGTVRFFLGDPDSGGQQIGFHVLSDINADENETAWYNWKAQVGDHEIFVKVENASPNDENLSNQEVYKSIEVTAPDLKVAASDIGFNVSEPELNDWVTIAAKVHNLGPETGTGYVRYYDGTPSAGTFIDEEYVMVFAEGNVNSSVSWQCDSTGWHTIHVEIVFVHSTDSNPVNNNATKQIHCKVIDQPDLAVVPGSLSIGPSPTREGDNLTVQAQVTNYGELDAQGTLEFWLENVSTGIQLGKVDFSTISKGMVQNVTLPTFWTPSEGWHNLAVRIVNMSPDDDAVAGNDELSQTFRIGEPRRPDFTPTAILVDISEPREGDIVQLSATIKNQGEGRGRVLVEFYDGDPDQSGQLIGNETISLLSQDIKLASTTWNPEEGTFNVTVVLTSIGVTSETEMDNNDLSRIIDVGPERRPDLTFDLDSITYDTFPKEGDNISLRVNLTNLGEIEGTASLRFWEGDPDAGGTLMHTIYPAVVPLDNDVTFTFTQWQPPKGIHNVTMVIDGVSPEDANLSNNRHEITFEVIENLQKADLHIVGFILSTVKVTEDEKVTITLRVANNGSETTPAFEVKFYLDDALVHGVTVDAGVNPYAFHDVVTEWPVEALPGSHQFKVKVDALDQVMEADETNNEAVIQLVVTKAEDDDGFLPGFGILEFLVSMTGVVVVTSFRGRRLGGDSLP